MSLGKGSSPITGYRYYFSLLMGISRGPIDQISQIMAGGVIIWDGTPTQTDGYDYASGLAAPYTTTEGDPAGYNNTASWAGGPVTTTTNDVPITRPDAFGGDAREGGMNGLMDVFMGDKAQVIGGRILDVMQGLRLSQLRGVVTAFYDGLVCSNNPYPKAMKFRIRRALMGWDGAGVWYPERAVIPLVDTSIGTQTQVITSDGSTITTTNGNGDYSVVVTGGTGNTTITTHTRDGGTTTVVQVPPAYNNIYAMNPAHIIYECCTNKDWGRGLDRALMDEVAFTSCANDLYDEGFGLCLKWSRADDIDQFVQMVIDHIGAVVYTNRITGLLSIRLIRGNYDISSLPTVDYSHGLVAITNNQSAAHDATSNEVIVKYHSPVTDMDNQARAQNIASISALGSVFSVTREYPGLPNADLALRVAQRELKAMSAGMRIVEFSMDRRGYLIVPGDVLIVNAPDRGLTNVIVRVATIEDTGLSDGVIKITSAQDVFGLPLTPFTSPPEQVFLQPNLNPVPITNQLIQEATYRDVFRVGGQAFASTLEPTASYVAYLAEAPTPSSYGFEFLTQVTHSGHMTPDTDLTDFGLGHFSKMGAVSSAITTWQTVIPVDGGLNAHTVIQGSALLIFNPNTLNSEFVKLVAIVRGTDGVVRLTVARGCVDTPARAFPANCQVWAYDQGRMVDPTEYVPNDTVGAIGLTKTSRGVLAQALATEVQTPVMFRRAWLPYPPADVRANGYQRTFEPGTISGDLVITWKHRERVLQQDILFDELGMNSIGPEDGVNYTVIYFGNGGLVTHSLGAVATDTLTSADAAAAGIAVGPMKVTVVIEKLDPVSGIYYQQPQFQNLSFNYDPASSGFGLNFGNNYLP